MIIKSTVAEKVSLSHEPADLVVKEPAKVSLQTGHPTISPYFLSRPLDLFMSGGGSLVFFVLCMLFCDRSLMPFTYVGVYPNGQTFPTPILSQASWIFFVLSFVCNFPHFLLSYQFLYWDCRKEFFREKRYIWAGIVVPVVILGGMTYVALARKESVPFFIYAMYVLVGWHYAKQAYGIFILSSARNGAYFSQLEKLILRISLLTLGAIGWVGTNTNSQMQNFNGFFYSALNFPYWAMTSAQAVFFLLAIVFFGLLLTKYVRTGVTPSATAILAVASMMVWYLPVFYHPLFMFAIPFFHSLQYLWFGTAFRRNKVRDQLQDKSPVQYRAGMLTRFWGYLLLAGILGAVTFNIVPNFLDRTFPFESGQYQFPPLLFAAFAAIFLNIHHFFIDNVIWKKENPAVGKYLLKR